MTAGIVTKQNEGINCLDCKKESLFGEYKNYKGGIMSSRCLYPMTDDCLFLQLVPLSIPRILKYASVQRDSLQLRYALISPSF